MPGDADRYRPPRVDEARELGRSLQAPVVGGFASLASAVPDARGNEARLRHVNEALTRRMEELELEPELRGRATRALAPFFEDATPSPPGIGARVALVTGEDVARFGLPFPADDRAFVGGCAPVRTLLRAARDGAPYRVLAISLNRVRVAAGDVRGVRAEPHPDLPSDLVDALGAEIEGVGLQLHSAAAGGESPIRHGHHDASTEREIDRERFHHVLGDALVRAFAGSSLPIVLLADRTHEGLAAALGTRLPLAGRVEGSPDRWSERELHERAWPLVQQAALDAQAQRHEQLERARGQGRAVLGLQPCLEAVAEGRVRRLWVPAEPSVTGAIDVDARRAVAAFGDEDLLDALACEALRRGAEVETLEPGHPVLADAELAAELW